MFLNEDYAVLTPHYSLDKVTLLSSDEVSQYFLSNNTDLNAEPTDYAVMQLRMSSRDISAGSGWLLRSPFTVGHGNSARCASAYNGMNYNLKSSVLSTLQDYNYSIRPAMWLSISG